MENIGYYDREPLQTVRVADIDVAYKSFGSGEPLVLITAYIATMDTWDPFFLETLATRYRVVVFDNRGMGKTSCGEAEWTMERFADDTAGFIEVLGLSPSNVLGWSMGGDVALALSVRRPDVVKRLVVYAGDCGGTHNKVEAPGFFERLKGYRAVRARFKFLLAELFPASWMEKHPDYWRSFEFPREMSSPVNIIRQNRAYKEWPGVCSKLAEIKVPVLVVTGTEDSSTLPENSLMLAERIPQSWRCGSAARGTASNTSTPRSWLGSSLASSCFRSKTAARSRAIPLKLLERGDRITAASARRNAGSTVNR